MECASKKIAAIVELESHHLRSELSCINQMNCSEAKKIARQITNKSVDSVWIACANDFIKLSSFSFFKEVTNANGTPMSAKMFQTAYLNMMKLSVLNYEESREQLKEKTSRMIDDWQGTLQELSASVQKTFQKQSKFADRIVQQCRPQAILASLAGQKVKEYKYHCHNSEKNCAECSALDGSVFAVADAQEQINFPPMHPNCQCMV